MNPLPLQGRRLLITGAARGLGQALTLTLSQAGAEVIASARSLDALAATAALLDAHGLALPAQRQLALDLCQAEAIEAAANALNAQGPLHGLINNAAQWLAHDPAGHPAHEVFAVVNGMVAGSYLLTQGLLPLLQASGGGDVLTIGSISGLNMRLADASLPFYAAKHGQLGFIEGLRQLLRGTSVRAIGIHPPNIDEVLPGTPAWDASPLRDKAQRLTQRDVCDAVLWALTRPRSVTVASLVLDNDAAGIYG